jgi:hypothetical protein
MNTTDDLEEQLRAFHIHWATLHKQQQQNLLLRSFARIQQASQLVQTGEAPTHPLLVRVRRFVSRQLIALAHWIEPLEVSSQAEVVEDVPTIEAEFRVLEAQPAEVPTQDKRKELR